MIGKDLFESRATQLSKRVAVRDLSSVELESVLGGSSTFDDYFYDGYPDFVTDPPPVDGPPLPPVVIA